MTLLRSEGSGEVSTGFYNGIATQSARFRQPDSSYLYRVNSSDGNRNTMSFSWWYKRGQTSFGSYNIAEFFNHGGAGGGGSQSSARITLESNKFNLAHEDNNSTSWELISNALFRDHANFYHFFVAIDTTQSTASNRVRVYVNGTEITDWGTSTYPSQNADLRFGQAKHYIGVSEASGNPWTATYLDGYMCDVIYIDGTALTPSSFGEFVNGVWIAKEYSGSYGTNGHRLEFKNTTSGGASPSSSTIGADTSGNDNHYNDYNFSPHDSNLPDSPENNFAVWNALFRGGEQSSSIYASTTLSQGNLVASVPTNSYMGSTFRPASGKWYVEIRLTTLGSTNGELDWGWIQATEYSGNTGHSGQANKWGAFYHGYSTNHIRLYDETSQLGSNINLTISAGSILQLAWDIDNNKGWIGIDNTYYRTDASDGNPSAGTNEAFTFTDAEAQNLQVYVANGTSTDVYTVNFGQDDTFAGAISSAGNTDDNGNGKFKYAPPTGFLACCSANLPDPSIGPQASEQAVNFFNVTIWSGDGADGREITQGSDGADVGHSPDLVWIKSRNLAGNDWNVHDSVRGGDLQMFFSSGGYYNESSTTTKLEAFITNGFRLGQSPHTSVNSSSGTYVALTWAGSGGPTATNSAGAGNTPTSGSVIIDGNNKSDALAGTIPATKITANTTAGFSVVSYVGTGSEGTVAHGLSSPPEVVIIKNRTDSRNWVYGHASHFSSTPFDGQLYIGTGGAFSANDGSFGSTAPTSTVVNVNSDQTTNESGDNMIMWCWHSVEGFSKMGKYTGNNSTDGTFVFTGFRPRLVILKRASDSGSFQVLDTRRKKENPTDVYLTLDGTHAEVDGSTLSPAINVDFLSNGFKIRSTESVYNSSGGKFVYMAYAEQPFKFNNAK